MDCEDGFAAFEVGTIHDDLTIESPGSHQRRVQHLGCVGSSHDDDAPGRIEAVHLGQQLIERLFSLLIAENPSAPAGARLSDRIQFIDKDDTGSLLLGFSPPPPHPPPAHPHAPPPPPPPPPAP